MPGRFPGDCLVEAHRGDQVATLVVDLDQVAVVDALALGEFSGHPGHRLRLAHGLDRGLLQDDVAVARHVDDLLALEGHAVGQDVVGEQAGVGRPDADVDDEVHGVEGLDPATAVGNTGCLVFEAVMWVVLFHAIGQMKMPVMRVFGIGRACTVLGIMVGMAAASRMFDLGLLGQGYGTIVAVATMVGVVSLILTSTFLLNEGVIASEGSAAPDEEDSEEQSSEQFFARRCDELIDEGRLTKREAEIFVLLAKGSSARDVEELLFISNHAVKAHAYNIYRKLGIHSRSELSDLFR